MTRPTPIIFAMTLALCIAVSVCAEDTKPKQVDPAAAPEKIAQTDDPIAEPHKMEEKEVPVSFIKSEYNDFMTNVSWMNRNGIVVGAPAWKGGEDGLHCH